MKIYCFMELKNKKNFETILHLACLSGNLELVKFIISLNKIDIKSKTIFYLFIFIQFLIIINLFYFKKIPNFNRIL